MQLKNAEVYGILKVYSSLDSSNYYTGALIVSGGVGISGALNVNGNLTFNTITSGTWNGSTILTSYGGTGVSSYTAGDLLYYASGTAFTKLAIGGAGRILRSTGSAPAWTTITIPDTVAIGSILATNTANILTAVTSASGLKILQNSAGAVSWNTTTGTGNSVLATSPTLTGSIALDGQVTQTGNYGMSNNFASGSLGTGWKVDYNLSVASKSYLEVDNILVRDTLRTHIFQKDIIKATNGQLYISDSGVIADDYVGSNTIYLDIDKSATFSVNDVLTCKDVNLSNGQLITTVTMTVSSLGTASGGKQPYVVSVTAGSLSSLQKGMTIVRTSGGTILLDSSTANSPFIDIILNGTIKARLGNLEGKVTGGGYGLWSDNVFLTGSITATSGAIGGWDINTNSISKNNIVLDSNTGYLKIGTLATTDPNTTNIGLYANNAGSITIKAGATANTNYLKFDSGVLVIDSTSFTLKGSTTLYIDTTKIALGTSASGLTVAGTSAGTVIDNAGGFLSYGDANNFIRRSGTSLEIKSATFTLSSGNLVISGNSTSSYLEMGTLTSTDPNTTNIGFYVDNSGNMLLKAGTSANTNYLRFLSNAMTIDSTAFTLKGSTTLYIDTSKIALGTSASGLTVAGTSAGTVIDNAGGFLSYGDANNYIRRSGTSLDIKAGAFNLSAGNLVISGNSTSSYIEMGTLASTDPNTTNIGFYVDNSGNMLLKAGTTANTNYLRFLSNAMTIDSTAFTLKGSTTLYIDTTKIALGTSASGLTVAGTSAGTVIDNAGGFLSYGDANNFIRRSGTSLEIKSATFTLQASTAGSIGLTATSYSAGNGIWLSSTATSRFRVGNASASRMQWDDTNLEIYNSSNVKVASFGASNTIAGWSITDTLLSSSGGINLVSSATAANNKIYIGTGTYGNANTSFLVDGSGRFSLKDKLTWDGTTLTITGGGTFSGALSAASGTFTGALSGGTISIGSGNSIFKADSNGIYLGNATFASAPFRVNLDGGIIATNVDLTGIITVDQGFIGGSSGWAITGNKISSSNSDNSIAVGTTIPTAYNSNDTGLYFDGLGRFRVGEVDASNALVKGIWWNGSNLQIKSPNFSILEDGSVVANNGIFTGVINATSGSFTGVINATSGSFSGHITTPVIVTQEATTGASYTANSSIFTHWDLQTLLTFLDSQPQGAATGTFMGLTVSSIRPQGTPYNYIVNYSPAEVYSWWITNSTSWVLADTFTTYRYFKGKVLFGYGGCRFSAGTNSTAGFKLVRVRGGVETELHSFTTGHDYYSNNSMDYRTVEIDNEVEDILKVYFKLASWGWIKYNVYFGYYSYSYDRSIVFSGTGGYTWSLRGLTSTIYPYTGYTGSITKTGGSTWTNAATHYTGHAFINSFLPATTRRYEEYALTSATGSFSGYPYMEVLADRVEFRTTSEGSTKITILESTSTYYTYTGTIQYPTIQARLKTGTLQPIATGDYDIGLSINDGEGYRHAYLRGGLYVKEIHPSGTNPMFRIPVSAPSSPTEGAIWIA